MNPLVSVIIPVHNGGAYLREALQSVFAQDYVPFEVLVADDASADDSAAIAAGFGGVQVLRLPKGGVSRARNLAAAASRGEFLAFLDADDLWLPGKLTAQVSLALERETAGFVLCNQVHRFDGPVPPWFDGPTDGAPAVAYEPSAWLVRRSTFERVGGFDEGRSLGEDTEWLARAWDLSVTHAIHPEPLVVRRIHGGNVSGHVPRRRVMLDILRESVGRKRARQVAPDG